MSLLIAYALLAIGVSFLCSLLEACLLSLPRSYVESLADAGSRAGQRLVQMKRNIDRPLAAILTLNTVAHTAGAAGVGAQAAKIWSGAAANAGAVDQAAAVGSGAAVGIASAIMTLLVLIFSEIIPKTLGATHAKKLAPAAAILIRVMIWITYPVIVPLEWINRVFSTGQNENTISRAELLATIKLGEASGAMRRREYNIASNLIALSSIRVSDILTPRTVVFSLPEDMTVREARDKHAPIRFGRVPVYAGEREEVTGYVPRHVIHVQRNEANDERPLKDFAKPIPILPETASAIDALEMLMLKKQHIALAVDEYGGMAGLVTLEDVIETLLGEEIIDETDTVEDMRELARRKRSRRIG
jgi:CBS domain containing-hemolysin-like protein